MSKNNLVLNVEDVMTDSVILSSKGRDWPGIEVMEARLDFNELSVPALASHTVVLNLGQPFDLSGDLEGRHSKDPMYKNAVKIIPATIASQWNWVREIKLNLLHLSLTSLFTDQIIQEAELDPTRLELIPRIGVMDAQIEQIGRGLLAELHNGGLAGRIYTEALTNLLVVHLLRHYSSLGPAAITERRGPLSTKALKLVTDYIQTNLDQDLRLQELAALVNLSPYYFSRLFKQTTGLAPHQYLIRLRVERAKELLLTTPLSIQQIASAVGFTDQSHLTRQFRAVLGVTPSDLRRG